MPLATMNDSEFRRVLGHVPTGVVVITSVDDAAAPVGLAVGSFTSVSLDPPLVGFLPARTSTTFPKIERSGRFCVNVLAAGQEPLSRAFAARGADKFASVGWHPGPAGLPRLDGAVAWIDCTVEAVAGAGDHYFVTGRVHDLTADSGILPLTFFQGGYGSVARAES